MRYLRRLMPAPVVALVRRLRDAPQTTPAGALLAALVRKARADRITGLVAEVAFFVILSVFPALLVMALALGFLGSILGDTVAQEARSRVLGALQRVLTSDARGTVDAVGRLFTEKQTGLLTFSTLAAVWSTGRGFAALVRALGQVYGVAD